MDVGIHEQYDMERYSDWARRGTFLPIMNTIQRNLAVQML